MKIKKQIIVCTHHKTGSALFVGILTNIAKEFNLKLQICEQDKLDNDTDIWIQWHSYVDFTKINVPYIGVHSIRDPRDVIISGYFYHMRCSEEWVLKPRKDLGNKSYQEYLQGLAFKEGVLFEMNNSAKRTINNIMNWDYGNPNIIEIRMEEIICDFEKTFENVFRFFGYSNNDLCRCMNIANNYNINLFSEDKIKLNNHIHSRGVNKWKIYFNVDFKREFINLFGDVLIQLGYERDNNW